jgi:hypothetical protein
MTKEEIQAELAKTKAARVALEEGADEESRLLEELERERRKLSDAQAIKSAEGQHGPAYRFGEDDAVDGRKIAAVPTDLGVVIVKRPHQALVRRFQASKTSNSDDAMGLVGPSLVHPARSVFEEMLKEQDVILARVARAALELAGFRQKEMAGK